MSSFKQKKIIIIGSAFPLRGGGIATFNERLAKEFKDQGHQVSIYSFSLQYPNFLFPGKSQFSNEQHAPDVEIKTCINSINPFNWIKVGISLKNENADIVIVRYWLPFMGPCLGTILRIVKKNKFSKIICIADNIIPHEKRIGDTIFTKYFVKPVDAFVTMSSKVLEDLKTFSNKPAVKTVHPLYDNFGEIVPKAIARNKLELPLDTPIILFFGFIRKYKGLDILLRALKIITEKKSIPNLKLLIAGEFYENRSLYDNLIKELDIEDSLILRTEFIEDEKVKYYLSASDFVIQPYRNATQSGVTPLAYHFEKSMLITNVGGLTDMVEDGKVGLVADPNEESIAQKIEELYKFGDKYFIRNLKEEKKKYSWEKLTNTILEL